MTRGKGYWEGDIGIQGVFWGGGRCWICLVRDRMGIPQWRLVKHSLCTVRACENAMIIITHPRMPK